MKSVGSLASALWIPVVYRIAPRWLAHQSLRGFLKQQGVDILGMPLAVSQELAEDTYEFTRLQAKLLRFGLWSELGELTTNLELCALQIRALLFAADRQDGFLSTCHRPLAILQKHGIHVPPVLVDRHNQVIQ